MLVKYEGDTKLVYRIDFVSDGKVHYAIRKSEPQTVMELYKGVTPKEIKRYSRFFEVFIGVGVEDVEVIESSIPPDWITKYMKGYYNHYSLFNKYFESSIMNYRSDFSELYGDILDYERTLIANKMLVFHGLPPIEIPPNFIPEPYLTEAEERLTKELDSYLEYADK